MRNQLDIQVQSLRFVISRSVGADWKMAQRSNKHWLLAFFKSGRGVYRIEQEEHRVEANSVVLIPPELAYQPLMDPLCPWSYCTVGLYLQWGDEASLQALRALPPVTYAPELKERFDQLQNAWDAADPVCVLQCRSILLDILQQLLSHGPRKKSDARMEPVLRTIQRNVGGNYSLEELAAMTGQSVSTFRRQFRETTGMTAVEYQNHVRIQKAKALLRSGDCNVSEAAREVGMDNVFYFSRLFRRLTGVNPSAYIIGNRQKENHTQK